MERWTEAVISRYPVVEIGGRVLEIGDTIKVGKEAQKMPGVKKLVSAHKGWDLAGFPPRLVP